MDDYWFRPKQFGYGATPSNWKGWASSLAVIFAMLAIIRFFMLPAGGPQPFIHVLIGAVMLAALVGAFTRFARAKTEGDWQWRWGGKDER